METTAQLSLQIPAIGRRIVPKILVWEDFYRTNLYAQENGLKVLTPQEVTTLATFLQIFKLGDEETWLKQQLENSNFAEHDFREAVDQLYDYVWKAYSIRVRGILAYRPYSTRLINAELPESRQAKWPLSSNLLLNPKPLLIPDYEITEKYEIDLNGLSRPYIQVNWPKNGGNIDKGLARLLGVLDYTHLIPGMGSEYYEGRIYEGLHTLVLDFCTETTPVLLSGRIPSDSDPDEGSLFGIA